VKRANGQPGPEPLTVLEEAFHLVRRAPLGAWACYYVGTLPFAVVVLYFWADMSRSALAAERCLSGALIVAGGLLWMKCWQGVYAGMLRRELAGGRPRPWTPRRVWRLVVTQAILQPAGLYLLPMAFIVALPFGWAYAFYQNVTALADVELSAPWQIAGRCWRQAALWQKQNHALLLLMLLFVVLVLLNVAIALAVLPMLGKSLLGLEMIFARNPLWWANSTTLAVAVCLTYLAVAPLMTAVYVLRCFYGESVQTGEDLRAQLSRLGPVRRGAVAAVLLAAAILPADRAHATPASRPAPPAAARPHPRAGVSPKKLDRTIQQVLTRREYAWRMPRKKPDGKENVVRQFLKDLGRWIREGWGQFERWLRKALGPNGAEPAGGGSGWPGASRVLLYLLGLGILGALIWLVISTLRKRPAGPVEAEPEPVYATPDLTDENVVADQLPEDGWAKLAAEMLAKGELRLALRALYLGSLAYLSRREMILLARSKSNRDYERELARRGHGRTELCEAFGTNVTLFEDAWYGMHDVTDAVIGQFRGNQQRIRTHAEG
jgi:hypothetical protein